MLKFVFGKKMFRSFFNKLFIYGLKGKNYFNAGNYKFSGESNLIQRIKNDFNENDGAFVYFDVGSANGDFCNFLCQIFENHTVKAHLFEPASSYFPELIQRFKMPNIRINQIGIGAKNEEVELYCSSKIPALNSIYDRKRDFWNFDFEYDIKETIKLNSLKTYIAKNNVSRIDYLKLDTEGNELDCLIGCKSYLESGMIKSISFEFGGANIDSRTFFYDFWNLLHERYDLYRILKDGLDPITKYSNELEVYIAANYYAKLKS